MVARSELTSIGVRPTAEFEIMFANENSLTLAHVETANRDMSFSIGIGARDYQIWRRIYDNTLHKVAELDVEFNAAMANGRLL